MADSNHLPEPLMDRLRRVRGLEPFLVGFINMLNLFNNALQVRYHGEYALLATDGGPAR